MMLVFRCWCSGLTDEQQGVRVREVHQQVIQGSALGIGIGGQGYDVSLR